MPVYVISCALRATNHDFAPLWKALEGAKAQRALDTTWLVDVDLGIEQVTRAVLAHLTRRDRALIVEIAPNARWSATRLLPRAGRWLKGRRP